MTRAVCSRTERMARLDLEWRPAEEMVAAEFYGDGEIPVALRACERISGPPNSRRHSVLILGITMYFIAMCERCKQPSSDSFTSSEDRTGGDKVLVG